MKYAELNDLPNYCLPLIESIEIIATAETLHGDSGYFISKYGNERWIMKVGKLPCSLIIPINVSQYTPPQMKIRDVDLNKISNLNKFEDGLKELKIIVNKKIKRRTGYINMGGSIHTNEEPHWELLFADQSKFYDFYLLCKQHNLF